MMLCPCPHKTVIFDDEPHEWDDVGTYAPCGPHTPGIKPRDTTYEVDNLIARPSEYSLRHTVGLLHIFHLLRLTVCAVVANAYIVIAGACMSYMTLLNVPLTTSAPASLLTSIVVVRVLLDGKTYAVSP